MNRIEPAFVASEDLRFDRGGRDLAALRYGTRGGTRVLALHGWLDNAMSFAPLAAQLPELDLVALDLPGHGHSAHRPPRTWYHYIDYLDDALLALDALGWDRCVLLGHSLGGAVASVLAAARPERVEGLLLIEAPARFILEMMRAEPAFVGPTSVTQTLTFLPMDLSFSMFVSVWLTAVGAVLWFGFRGKPDDMTEPKTPVLARAVTA